VIEFKRRVYEQALNELARFLNSDHRRGRPACPAWPVLRLLKSYRQGMMNRSLLNAAIAGNPPALVDWNMAGWLGVVVALLPSAGWSATANSAKKCAKK
jgi:hypothetical protein